MTHSLKNPLSEYEQHLVAKLRDKTNGVKYCFTRYSFHTLTIGGDAPGIVFRYIWDVSYVTFAGAFFVLVAMAVAHIGSHPARIPAFSEPRRAHR